MKKKFLLLALVVLAGALTVTAALVRGNTDSATASSHREAPLTSLDQTADNTDVYAFRSPDRPDTITLIASYIPLEEPANGPDFYNFDPNVLYEIHVDNNGDAEDDVTYQFRFRTELRNPNTFLYNTGPITTLDDPDFNLRQFYTVTRVTSAGSTVVGSNLPVPPVRIGPRSTPDYEPLAESAVRELTTGSKVFAGQRDDSFFIDIGSGFDLLGLRPFNPFHLIQSPRAPIAFGSDGLSGYNVHSIAIQVPIASLAAPPMNTIGVWASASRPQLTTRAPGTSTQTGSLVQVSRLANPLFNELLNPRPQKDAYNGSRPADDATFAPNALKPEPAALINLLYPALPDAPETGRTDIEAVFLTGVPTLNFTGPKRADLMRLNFTVPVTASPNRLGALAGDFQGFPNGRRLTDDVVDIELRALACGYGPILQAALGLCNLTPNNTLGDGVSRNDAPFLRTFPYIGSPHEGYEHGHDAAFAD